MPYNVTTERSIPCLTAVVRAETTWKEFPRLWRSLLDDVWAFLRSTPGVYTGGHNVMLYRDDVTGVVVVVEVGVQVSVSFEARGRVVPSTLPGADVATTHAAMPAELGAAHDAIRAWCLAHDRAFSGVRWEVYGDPDPRTGAVDVGVYWQLAEQRSP